MDRQPSEPLASREETDRMAPDVLVDLSTAIAIIGVVIALFLRADRKIDEVDAKSVSRFEAMDSKFESRFDKVDVEFGSRFDKVDARFVAMDSKFESRFDKVDVEFGSRFDKVDARFEKMDSKFDSMAQDVVEIKVSVARIEGYLQARDGYAPGGRDRPASRPDVDQPPGGYRQTG